MCGYNPFWYLDYLEEREQAAYEAGYESVEDYYNALESQQENDDYDRYADDKVEQEYKQEQDEDLEIPF